MARRAGLQSTLFPFMSVLACTIGSLIVLLAVMSIAAVAATSGSEQALEESRAEQAVDLLMLESQRAVLDDAEALWEQVDEALAERGLEPGQTAFELSRSLAAEQERAQASQLADRLAAELAEWTSERESVETSIAVLESRRETLPILIDPTGLSRNWKPFFMETDAGGATAYRATDDFSYFVPFEELATSGDFGRYLRRVRAVPGALLVLLVRPDGLETMERVETIVRNAGVRVARLPLPGEGELDWSLLRRAEGEG